jgi:hypothetical protein
VPAKVSNTPAVMLAPAEKHMNNPFLKIIIANIHA